MHEKKVSVIVPVYNVESYLNECVRTIVDQTFSDLEIILVDDGSTDQSGKMCDDWIKQDNRIKVIHKQNQGLGMARNSGLDVATGEYVCFVDSDDMIDASMIETTYKMLQEFHADIALYGCTNVDENGNFLNEVIPHTNKPFFEGKEIVELVLPSLIYSDLKNSDIKDMHMSSCMMLLSMSIVNEYHWRFVSEREIISEDYYSLLELYQYINTICVVPSAFYKYRNRNGSLSRSYDKERFGKINHWYLESCKLCDKANYPSLIVERLGHQYIGNVIAAMKSVMRSKLKMKRKYEEVKRIVNDDILQRALDYSGEKNGKKTRWIFCDLLKKKKYLLICLVLLK